MVVATSSAAIVSKMPYERWLADAPERKKRNDEVYAIVAKSNPAQADKMMIVPNGWDPDGYSWALALTTALQALAVLTMATARRRGRAISM